LPIDQDELGQIRENTILGNLGPFVSSHVGLIVATMTVVLECFVSTFLGGFFEPASHTPSIIYWALVISYAMAILLLRPWALRRRISHHFHGFAFSTMRIRTMRFVHITVDYAINSAFIRFMICATFTAGYTIAWFSIGGDAAHIFGGMLAAVLLLVAVAVGFVCAHSGK
jgi:hypothetical protein